MIRFGLVGYGAWGKHHADAIRQTEGAALQAVATSSESTAAVARQSLAGVDVHADFRALLARPDIDVVDIVLPSFLHHEVASLALRAGKHVLLEKPMCLSIEQCRDLISLAAQHDRLLTVGHELRLSSLWGKVKELIDNGYLGKPQYVLVELSRKPYRLGADGWRYDIQRVGNWILEEPIHFFDFVRWYLSSAGEPESIFAVANSRQVGHPELQDNFSSIIRFAGGEYGVVSQTLSAFEHHQTVKVTGTEGALWAGWSGAMDRTHHPTFFLKGISGSGEVESIPIEKITGEVFELQDQIALVTAAVTDQSPLMTTGADGMWSVAMCLAAQMSVDHGRPVAMSEVFDLKAKA
ncbi:MAG: Gfo/Idh/MocA family protein [Planctomycetaceae bacterium]